MGETTMALGDCDLERIGSYVKGNLYGWFVEVAPHLVMARRSWSASRRSSRSSRISAS